MGCEPQPGAVIADRYQVLSLLGRGGMGLVYRAFDRELREEVAIKILQPSFTERPSDLARFKREIITARKITHPNVIRIHDFALVDGQGLVSMECLPGGSLAARLSKGALPLEEGTEIAI